MKKFFKALLKMIRGNLVLKIAAVVFAVIMWSFVLSTINPPRERLIPDIPVMPLNIETLANNGLAISGNLTDILGTVDVRVNVKQNDLKLFNKSNVAASVDLSKIKGEGHVTLRVDVDKSYQVLSVSPSMIELDVERRTMKDVPVNVTTTGSAAAGYYADVPQISPDRVRITGAKSDVNRVKSALCAIDLAELRDGYSKSAEVVLLDENGEPVDPALFSETVTSVIVELSVLPVKMVGVDAKGSVIGQLAPGYEISDITCSPEKVWIVGGKDKLDGISSIKLIPFSVGGYSADIVVPMGYELPEGVRVLGHEKAQVTISIREITKQEDYAGVPIKIRNLASGLQAALGPGAVDVTVNAGVTRMSKLLRRDVVPYIDLDGLEPGQYTVSVMFEIPEGFVAENFTPAIAAVNVTITKK